MRMRWHKNLLIGATLSLVFVTFMGSKSYATDNVKLLASDGYYEDYFGRAVSISGDVVLVGAYKGSEHICASSGSAYIFRHNGSSWIQEDELVSSDCAWLDYFGYSLSISGDVALVGAYGDDDNGSDSGSAYIFRYNGSSWVQEDKLLPADGAAFDKFGHSVSISSNVALVGAYGDNENGSNSGSAYIFRYNGSSWVQETKLVPADNSASDCFGYSVSISGNVALVGAYFGDDDNSSGSGSAYIFRYNGSSWVQEDELLATDGATSDFFGWSVSISGDVALVGARSDTDNGSNSGSAYIFRYNDSAWVQENKLLPADGTVSDFFGWSVSISGDVALVGADGDNDNGSDSGSAYIFHYNGSSWVQEDKLLPADGAASDYYGYSVSISAGVALVGAPYDDDNGSDSGSAYVFDLKSKKKGISGIQFLLLRE